MTTSELPHAAPVPQRHGWTGAAGRAAALTVSSSAGSITGPGAGGGAFDPSISLTGGGGGSGLAPGQLHRLPHVGVDSLRHLLRHRERDR